MVRFYPDISEWRSSNPWLRWSDLTKRAFMATSKLPPCGIYRTKSPIGDAVPAGRLVYFHNHGDPGPGVYLPESWSHNRAQFSERGATLPSPAEQSAEALEALPAEGFYRVTKRFFCCEKKC